MLAALCDDLRVYAATAEKGREYLCPACRASLILRKGEVRVHHFAHRPPIDCAWGQGETADHLDAKLALHAALMPRALRAEMEWVLESLSGDRRADVYLWDMQGGRIAFELQHTRIGIDEIARRTAAYMAAGVAVVWLPFLRPHYRAMAERAAAGEPGDWVVPRYQPRAFERWISAFNFGEVWYWAPRSRQLMRGMFETPFGERSMEVGGFAEAPAALGSLGSPLVTLRLEGPLDPAALSLRVSRRKPVTLGRYEIPGGPMVRLSSVR